MFQILNAMIIIISIIIIYLIYKNYENKIDFNKENKLISEYFLN